MRTGFGPRQTSNWRENTAGAVPVLCFYASVAARKLQRFRQDNRELPAGGVRSIFSVRGRE